ncbi:hypothetical protein ACFL35_13720 [Candidatus Riflebacteria bacterium]
MAELNLYACCSNIIKQNHKAFTIVEMPHWMEARKVIEKLDGSKFKRQYRKVYLKNW